MATRFIKSKALIEHVTPANELLSVRVLDNGFRFRFGEKVLPDWFKDLARSLDFAMQDNDPARARGRDVIGDLDGVLDVRRAASRTGQAISRKRVDDQMSGQNLRRTEAPQAQNWDKSGDKNFR